MISYQTKENTVMKSLKTKVYSGELETNYKISKAPLYGDLEIAWIRYHMIYEMAQN